MLDTLASDNIPALPAQQVETLADRIVTQAEAGHFPPPAQVLSKLHRGDFELDGLNFKFKQVDGPHGRLLACSAMVGYLPYTAERSTSRLALQHILASTRSLRHGRFHLDRQNRIHLTGALPLPTPCGDEDIILAVLELYRETRPFLRLMAEQFEANKKA